MKIKKLQINNYKNLNADLVHNSDLIAFIGNNGSGKSNLLEANRRKKPAGNNVYKK